MTISKYTVLSDTELFQITGGTDWWLLGSGIVATIICVGAATANPLLVATGVLSVGAGVSLLDHAVKKANNK